MRTINKILILLSSSILVGCGTGRSVPSSFPEHNYSEVADKKISYKDSMSYDGSYLVYYFLETCHDCQMIKNNVIDFAINNVFPIYFIEPDSSCEHTYEINNIDKTIGSTNYKDIWVGVTPEIAIIENGKVVENKIGLIDVEYILDSYRKAIV